MARVTVEDCLKFVRNRFELVLIAAERAHKLEMGSSDPLVPLDNDKPTVVALREIASGYDVNKPRVIAEEAAEEESEIAQSAEEVEALNTQPATEEVTVEVIEESVKISIVEPVAESAVAQDAESSIEAEPNTEAAHNINAEPNTEAEQQDSTVESSDASPVTPEDPSEDSDA